MYSPCGKIPTELFTPFFSVVPAASKITISPKVIKAKKHLKNNHISSQV